MASRLKGSSNNGSYLYVDYTIGAKNVAGNYTDVSWTVGVHWGTYFFNIHDAKVTMTTTTGASVSSDTATILYNSGWPISGADNDKDHPFDSGTTRVHHSATGLGSIKFTGTAFWDTPSNFTSSIALAVSLPTIPRLSTAPGTPTITVDSSTQVHVAFTDGGGGAPIDSRQIGYGTNGSTQSTIIAADSDGSTIITGLTPGTTYYFWARTHNVAGFSPWSLRASNATPTVPVAPSAPTISSITQVSAAVSWIANGDGGRAITGYEIGIGLTSAGPTLTSPVTPASPTTVGGLSPGKTYYWWVRAENSVGWSAWSAMTVAASIAGARIKVGSVWKQAVPYVRTGGTWKLARPWSSIAGVWKETL